MDGLTMKRAQAMSAEEARRFLAFYHRRDFWLLKPVTRCVMLALMEMKRG